jgi:hypothetical protein
MSLVVEVHLLEASPSPWGIWAYCSVHRPSNPKSKTLLKIKLAIRCVLTLLVSDLHGLNQHPSCTAYPLLLTFEESNTGKPALIIMPKISKSFFASAAVVLICFPSTIIL